MSLSKQSVEVLLDLLEIKIGYMQVQDRDDAKELLKLRYCKQELLRLFEGEKLGRVQQISKEKKNIAGQRKNEKVAF